MKTFLGSRCSVGVSLLALAMLVAACGAPSQAGRPGQTQIDRIEIQILESFPVQVDVLIKGSLPDSCTEVDRIDQRFDPDKNLFSVDIATVRAPEDVCAQVLVPFERAVQLDVYGLPAGTYAVDVHGTREAFTLQTDNAIPDAGLPNPASAHCEERGYRVEIRTDDQGNQYGVCIFPDGSECDEWAFFRGECGPAD